VQEQQMETAKQIRIDGKSPLFDRTGMFHKSFPSDFRQIRYFTLTIVQNAPTEFKEINLLEQQISELIKNAVKHGNGNDIRKTVQIWFRFDEESARLIVQDEGRGFTALSQWNEFNRERTACFQNQDYEKLSRYVSWITKDSDEHDGGNALFAALEYWDGGVVFTEARNCVAVARSFPRRRHGILLQGVLADGQESDG
jgi:serine/threonine-protein kinase RsbW